MGALFCQPLAFTVVSSSAALSPASNAALNEPGLEWRMSGTTGHVIVDLGAGAGAYDTIALIGTNLRAADTVRVRTGTTNTGIGGLDTGVTPAFAGAAISGFSSKAIRILATLRTERYVRIDIAGIAGTVQRIVIGKSVVTAGIDYDCDQTIIDMSDIETVGNAEIVLEYGRRIRWKFQMSTVDETQWKAEWLSLLVRVGKSKPILFIPFSDTPADWQADAIFGRIRNEANGKSVHSGRRTVELTIESLAS